jgi:hypothetical protein
MASIYFDPDQSQLFGPWNMPNKEFAEKFPGVKGLRADSFSRWVGYASATDCCSAPTFPVARIIFRKARPSNHKCDARCRHAKGRNCECSCGGKNHGHGG